jgi:hypothetical protein
MSVKRTSGAGAASCAPALARLEVVDVEAVHVAAVQVQAHHGLGVRGNAGAMDVIGIRDEARDRARIEEEHAAGLEVDLVVALAVRIHAHVASLVQRAAKDAHHAPAAVVVDRGPLSRGPDEREEREVLLGRDVDGVPRVVVGIGAVVLGAKETLGAADERVHRRRDRLDGDRRMGGARGARPAVSDERFQRGVHRRGRPGSR